MKSQKKQRMGLVAAGAIALGMCFAATTANATTITASVGGVPTGADCYENFNSLALGGGGGTTTACGINVSFNPAGQVVQGGASGLYAAPVLSNGNGALFGDSDGADASYYLTAGGTSAPDGSGSFAQLVLPTSARYLGLLWGSVDSYNTITFYMGGNLVETFGGDAVSAAAGSGNCANGNQSTVGTCYVNISLSEAFDRVVMTSSNFAFEFDNVAFAENPLGVPEPGEISLFLLGLLLVGAGYRYHKRKLV
jgi:hypothetical protein